MKILKIWDADYPWDIRVEKICRALASQGHEVHLLCRNLKGLPSYETWEYGYIHRLPSFSSKRINYSLSFPAFFSPIWFVMAWKLINNHGLEMILVRDLPLALTAIIVGRLTARPIIWDMAENYTFLVQDTWRYEHFRPQNFIMRNPYLVRLIEKIAFKLAKSILVVVEESKQRLLSEGIENCRINIVGNTPDLNAFRSMSVDLSETDKLITKDRYVVLYVGGLEVSRGLEQVLDAMPSVVKEIPEVLFIVIGQGNSEKRLKDKVERLGLSKYFFPRGWVDFDYVLPFIRCSDVGIIPHYVTDHTDHTIPNKIFDFMSQGLPVITSAAKPMVRILHDERCGLTFRNTAELSQSLIKLHDTKLRNAMGDRGKRAVARRYNWDHDAMILEQVVNHFGKISKSE